MGAEKASRLNMVFCVPRGQDTERATQLIEGSSELAGASIGAAIGLIGGLPGAFGGAAVTVAATRILRRLGAEVQERRFAPRQRVRVGAAFTVAVEQIAVRLQAGDAPRSDGFFQACESERPAAEELLEGVLLAAGDSYEERKVHHLGRLYAAIAFDPSVSRAHANYLIVLGDRLTYRQLALMAIIWDKDVQPMIEAGYTQQPVKHLLFSDELIIEVDELERLGLIGRGQPGGTPQRGGRTYVDASGVGIDKLTLTGPGKRLYELMGLGDIGIEGRQEVIDALGVGWSTG